MEAKTLPESLVTATRPQSVEVVHPETTLRDLMNLPIVTTGHLGMPTGVPYENPLTLPKIQDVMEVTPATKDQTSGLPPTVARGSGRGSKEERDYLRRLHQDEEEGGPQVDWTRGFEGDEKKYQDAGNSQSTPQTTETALDQWDRIMNSDEY
jgi:hypothetical protein